MYYDRSSLHVAIAPTRSPTNTFVEAFARSIAEGGFQVHDYQYQTDLQKETNVIILHWPHDFFSQQNEQRTLELDYLLATWQSAKQHHGLRLVWVAHNVRPHDLQAHKSDLTERFLAVLDGIIHLSERSREIIYEVYGVRAPHELVCMHGHYRDDQLCPPLPAPPVENGIRLGFFGDSPL